MNEGDAQGSENSADEGTKKPNLKPKNKTKGAGNKNNKDHTPEKSKKDTGSKKGSTKKDSESQIEMVPQVLNLKPNKEILE